MKPRILFDYQVFQMQRRGGISRYFIELAKCISELQWADLRFAPGLHSSDVVGEISARFRTIGLIQRVPALPRSYQLRTALNSILHEWNMYRLQPDIWHPTYFRTRSSNRRSKIALTIYDLIHEKCRELMSPKDMTSTWRKESISKAGVIFAISNATKRDIVDMYGVSPGKIVVTHLANSLQRGLLPPHQEQRPYLLFVGPRWGYKNFQLLLRAYQESKVIREKFSIVCVGGEKPSPSESDPDLGIRFLSGVSDDQLSAIYAGAFALVYPSLYEGFGLPILEAMSMGCPVVTSGAGSLREVAGTSALYFNPEEPVELANAIKQLENRAERDGLVRSGFRREKEFSWNRCALETVEGYRRILKS